MGNITLTNTFVNATVADADEVNDNFTDITDVVNGSLDETNLSSTMALTVTTLTASTSISTDTIAEKTSTAGVTIDGVLIKDSLDTSGIVAKATAQTITGAKTFLKTIETIVTATDGATVTFDLSLGKIQNVVLGGNRTLALSNVSVGQAAILRLIQDGTGTRTVTWFATIHWDNTTTPVLTTTPNRWDDIGIICVAANVFDGFILGQNFS
jgi:hypothetical protein